MQEANLDRPSQAVWHLEPFSSMSHGSFQVFNIYALDRRWNVTDLLIQDAKLNQSLIRGFKILYIYSYS